MDARRPYRPAGWWDNRVAPARLTVVGDIVGNDYPHPSAHLRFRKADTYVDEDESPVEDAGNRTRTTRLGGDNPHPPARRAAGM